eukprot:2941143-Alexandrium_andersonii.AAC.1
MSETALGSSSLASSCSKQFREVSGWFGQVRALSGDVSQLRAKSEVARNDLKVHEHARHCTKRIEHARSHVAQADGAASVCQLLSETAHAAPASPQHFRAPAGDVGQFRAKPDAALKYLKVLERARNCPKMIECVRNSFKQVRAGLMLPDAVSDIS